MSKKLLIILLMLVALGVVIISFLALSGKLIRISPTTTPPLSNILYPAKPDPTGRDIVFYSREGKQILFPGVGVSYYEEGATYQSATNSAAIKIPSQTPNFVVGIFESWEDIPNSKDKYLILRRPAPLTVEGKEVNFPKVRVVFNTVQEALRSPNNLGTGFGVQELNNIVPDVKNESAPSSFSMGLISEYSKQDLDKLVKKGDALAVKIQFDRNNKTALKDKGGQLIASGLILRRFNAIAQINKELNRNAIKQ